MINANVLNVATQYIPQLKIAYKDQSTFMKLLSKILFFNPNFMTQYTTTIGYTIYYPSQSFVNNYTASSFFIFAHELVHMLDEKKISRILFGSLYLLPQLLILLAIPFAFIWGWWALLFVLLGAPLPAYFRMLFERRAYMVSIYVMKKLNDKCSYGIDLDSQTQFFLQQFKNSGYYYMWLFSNLDAQFATALAAVKNNERPYVDPVFDVIDQIIAVY